LILPKRGKEDENSDTTKEEEGGGEQKKERGVGGSIFYQFSPS
jgi:hypothetical protein